MSTHPAASIQVVVAHPDPLLALGLAAALDRQPGLQVHDLARGASGVAGDVVLTDYTGGLALAGAQRHHAAPEHRPARILVLATQDREQEVRTALERGVHGYLLACSRVDEVVEGVRALAQGQRYLSIAVAQRMADSMSREPLTARESAVLALLVQGCCNKTIARELGIAVGTVKAHVKGVMGKLDASSRTEAVSIAVERGMGPDRSPAARARQLPPSARSAPIQ